MDQGSNQPEERSPLFSVIVPTFGRPEFLAGALASVTAQTLADFECIVVDDASPTPVTPNLPDERFRLLRLEHNAGPAAARNTGLRAARGTFVAFLDDDDQFLPERLADAAELLRDHPVALCGAGSVGESGGHGYGLDGLVADRILDTTTPHLGATAVRRNVCLEFDESFRACEDLDWWLRMAHAHPVASSNTVGWLWRRHDGDRGALGAQARIDGSFRILAKHADYFAAHPRAAAFRWFRIGLLAREVDDAALRRTAARRILAFDRRPVAWKRAVWLVAVSPGRRSSGTAMRAPGPHVGQDEVMEIARRGCSDTPRFSVIVPTFGRPQLVGEALESVARQTVADFECIVVDDGTPGGCEIDLPDERFRVIRHSQNLGLAAARNTGLRAARGSGVIFLDDDDLFTPDRLTIAADGLAAAPVAICGAATVGSSKRAHPDLRGDVYHVILDTTTPQVGMTAIRRDACLEFDESYRASQDVEWWIRMAQQYPVTSDPRVGWVWRRHDAPRVTNGPSARLAASLRLFEDHADYFRTHPRAAAFRWFRIATMAKQQGDAELRRKAVREMVKLDRRPRTLGRAGRVMLGPVHQAPAPPS